jgi:hypothetical protein
MHRFIRGTVARRASTAGKYTANISGSFDVPYSSLNSICMFDHAICKLSSLDLC